MNEIKKLFVPDQATIDRVIGKWTPRTVWTLRIVILVFLAAWFGLWYYLHAQVKQSRARVEIKRIEESRRKESARRQAEYQEAMKRYQQAPRKQSRLYGE